MLTNYNLSHKYPNFSSELTNCVLSFPPESRTTINLGQETWISFLSVFAEVAEADGVGILVDSNVPDGLVEAL